MTVYRCLDEVYMVIDDEMGLIATKKSFKYDNLTYLLFSTTNYNDNILQQQTCTMHMLADIRINTGGLR